MDYNSVAQQLLEKKFSIDVMNQPCRESSRWVVRILSSATTRDLFHLQAAIEGLEMQVRIRARAGTLPAHVSSALLRSLSSLDQLAGEQFVVRMVHEKSYGTA